MPDAPDFEPIQTGFQVSAPAETVTPAPAPSPQPPPQPPPQATPQVTPQEAVQAALLTGQPPKASPGVRGAVGGLALVVIGVGLAASLLGEPGGREPAESTSAGLLETHGSPTGTPTPAATPAADVPAATLPAAPGTVIVWGYSGFDTFGLGYAAEGHLTAPADVALPGGVTAVFAGSWNAFALADGRLYGWGENQYGKIGPADLGSSVMTPTAIDLPGDVSVTGVASTAGEVLAVDSEGRVWQWGGFRGDQLHTLDIGPAVAVDATISTSYVLLQDGRILSWGSDTYGRLGRGETDYDKADQLLPVAGLDDVVAFDCGTRHCLALRADGTVWAWGCNERGALGDGTTKDRNQPVPVSSLSGLAGVTAVSASPGGFDLSLALTGDGTVYLWGYDYYDTVGWGSGWGGQTVTTPTPVPGLPAMRAITAAADGESYGIAADGTGWTWGGPVDAFGEDYSELRGPRPASILDGAQAVVANAWATFALF